METNNENTKEDMLDMQLEWYLNNLSEEEIEINNKKLDDLKFTDDIVFTNVLSKKQLCEEFLSVLLEKKISDLKLVEEQKSLKILPGTRGIRLDVYVEDANARYNIEMQVARCQSLPKRARFYQCNLDAHALKPGVYFDKLVNTYIVFICLYDPFNLGLPKYTVKQTFKESEKYKYDDGTVKIFFNALGFEQYENEQLRQLLEYCATAVPSSKLTKMIDSSVANLKNNEEWRKDVMTWQLKEALIRSEEYDKGVEHRNRKTE